jgi:hypothetical protein
MMSREQSEVLARMALARVTQGNNRPLEEVAEAPPKETNSDDDDFNEF